MNADDHGMRHALAARGVIVGANGQWEADPNFAGSNAVTPEMIRYLNESARQPKTNAHLKCQWVENLAQCHRRPRWVPLSPRSPGTRDPPPRRRVGPALVARGRAGMAEDAPTDAKKSAITAWAR